MFMAGLGVWFQSVTLPAGHISDFWVAQETKNVQQTSLKMNFLQNMYHSEQQPEIHQFSVHFHLFIWFLHKAGEQRPWGSTDQWVVCPDLAPWMEIPCFASPSSWLSPGSPQRKWAI
jgi:hypothetical protein